MSMNKERSPATGPDPGVNRNGRALDCIGNGPWLAEHPSDRRAAKRAILDADARRMFMGDLVVKGVDGGGPAGRSGCIQGGRKLAAAGMVEERLPDNYAYDGRPRGLQEGSQGTGWPPCRVERARHFSARGEVVIRNKSSPGVTNCKPHPRPEDGSDLERSFKDHADDFSWELFDSLISKLWLQRLNTTTWLRDFQGVRAIKLEPL
jgi:hypothetical protein